MPMWSFYFMKILFGLSDHRPMSDTGQTGGVNKRLITDKIGRRNVENF